jgi:hypothetical protein
MHKLPVLIGVLCLGGILAAACSSASSPAAAQSNGSSAQPVAAAQGAPLCQSANTCTAPTAEQHEIDCVNKIPYTNVLVPQGTTFEVMDKSGDFTCNDSGNVVDGKTVLTCYGKELYSFDLKLTNSACGGSNLATGTGQCASGYGYDSAQQCCAPVGGDSSSSKTITVDLGGCPLPRQ